MIVKRTRLAQQRASTLISSSSRRGITEMHINRLTRRFCSHNSVAIRNPQSTTHPQTPVNSPELSSNSKDTSPSISLWFEAYTSSISLWTPPWSTRRFLSALFYTFSAFLVLHLPSDSSLAPSLGSRVRDHFLKQLCCRWHHRRMAVCLGWHSKKKRIHWGWMPGLNTT